MSYILEALTRSEQEHQRGAVPDLRTVHTALEIESRRDLRWAYIAGGALLSAAVTFGVWLHVRTPEAPLQAAPVTAQPPPKAQLDEPAVMAPAIASPAALPTPASVAPVTAISAEKLSERPPAPRVAAAAPPAANTATSAAEAPRQTQTGQRSDHGPVNAGALPSALQREVPKISISGYSHSADWEDRMAVINDRAVREGDEIAGGLKVEEIAPNGVVFSYKGYRFRGSY